MATGVDPEEGGGTVYADAMQLQGNVSTEGVPVTPTPSITQDRTTSATPTSEHGGGNEPSPPRPAGTPLLATNLD